MTVWRDDPDAAADALIVASLPDLALPGGDSRALAIDAGSNLNAALRAHMPVVRIDRRASAAVPAPEHRPPTDDQLGFTHAFVRLPKSKDELEFSLHRLMAWLAPHGTIIIYGGNDEGIRSAPKRLSGLGVPIETVAAHSHGRVLKLQRPFDITHLKLEDAAWRRVRSVDFGDGVERPWISYPGLFAGGALDAGTALLLAHLPTHVPGARILDYGCGTGIVARAFLEADPTARVTALDVDAFALVATRENAPAATTMLGSRLRGSGRHDLIVSNPPIHDGFRENLTVLHQVVEDAPNHLFPKGRLVFVVQRRVPLKSQLEARFDEVEIIADDGPFRIWSASRPLKRAGRDGRMDTSAGKQPVQRYGDIEIGDEVEDW